MSDTMMTQEDGSREWLSANAALAESVRPGWASEERVLIDWHFGEVDSVGFVRSFPEVVIEQWFGLDDGVLTALQEPEIRVMAPSVDSGVFSAEQAARIAVSMMAAAVVLGSDATVSELRAAAVDAGLSTAQVYAAMGGSI